MLGSFDKEGQPAAQDGHRLGHSVRALGPAEAGGAAEQAGEGDPGRVGHQELRRVGVTGVRIAAARGLLFGDVGVDVAEDHARELGGEGEPLVAVARFGDDEECCGFGLFADHRGQRSAGLAGQGQRDEDQRTRADVHVAGGAGGLRGPVCYGHGPGQRR
jgi:hypothetical protein